jgi:fructose-specific component phosphotransferase system IIB-like protein
MKKYLHRIVMGKHAENKDHLEDLGVYVIMISKQIIEPDLKLASLGYRQIAGCCECGN